jgi:hypothetical protein
VVNLFYLDSSSPLSRSKSIRGFPYSDESRRRGGGKMHLNSKDLLLRSSGYLHRLFGFEVRKLPLLRRFSYCYPGTQLSHQATSEAGHRDPARARRLANTYRRLWPLPLERLTEPKQQAGND